MLLKACTETCVGLADRQCHCAIAQCVCSLAVYENPNLAYKRQIWGENLQCMRLLVAQ